jgi:hypothetical protein
VLLDFAGGPTLRLSVECLEAQLTDLDRPGRRSTRRVTSSADLVHRLDEADADFAAQFAALLSAKRESGSDVDSAVRTIIADVRDRGDQAVPIIRAGSIGMKSRPSGSACHPKRSRPPRPA